MKINYQDFIHPEDDAARRQLESVPGFQTATKYFLELGVEKFIHGLFMANKIRLSPTQLPEIYNLLPPVCEKFRIKEPEFYLEMDPSPNAYTIGDNQTFVVVTSGLLQSLDRAEQTAVIAHECGHIVCRHVFYSTMAMLCVLLADRLGMLGNLSLPVQYALKYWQRRSELSADRASLVFMGDAKPVIKTLVRLSGGPIELTEQVNVEEYAAQASSYLELQKNSKWNKLLQGMAVLPQDHPFSAIRVAEVLSWEKSEQFSILKKKLEESANAKACPHCGEDVEPNTKFCRFCGKKINERD